MNFKYFTNQKGCKMRRQCDDDDDDDDDDNNNNNNLKLQYK